MFDNRVIVFCDKLRLLTHIRQLEKLEARYNVKYFASNSFIDWTHCYKY